MRHIRQNGLKLISLCLTFCFLLSHDLLARKDASIVICAETGTIHHEHQADAVTHPASLTKMMTLYMTFKAIKEKKLSLHQTLPVSHQASKQAPCKLWLKPGSTITVREAILALITKSANDAAVVLAEALAGTEAKFSQIMTRQAQKLGMTKTVFKNASGLPNMQQVTTARDMATLSRSLYKHFPDFFHLFKTPKFVHKGVVHNNHNKLLRQAGFEGIKTGFINASGFNLAASVVRSNKRIIAVVMGGESAQLRDKKMLKLVEATFIKIKGKPSLHNENNSDSIEHLIQALGPITPSPKSHITHTAYLTDKGTVKVLKAKYNSVDEILNVIEEDKPKLVKVKSSSQKKPQKTTKSKIKASSTQKFKAKNKKSSMTNAKKQKPKKRLKQA